MPLSPNTKRIYDARRRGAARASGMCQHMGCSNKAQINTKTKKPMQLCEYHGDKYKGVQRTLRADRKAKGLYTWCKAKGLCTMCKAPLGDRKATLCIKHAKKRAEYTTKYTQTEKFALAVAARASRQKNAPLPSQPFAAQAVYKGPFLKKLLASCQLPTESDVYVDTEMIRDSANEAKFTYQWVFAKQLEGKWVWLIKGGTKPRYTKRDELAVIAKEVNAFIDGHRVVGYGQSKPEFNRITDLLRNYLPEDEPKAKWSYFDGQTDLANLIFTRAPEEEAGTKKKIYLYVQGMAQIEYFTMKVYDEQDGSEQEWVTSRYTGMKETELPKNAKGWKASWDTLCLISFVAFARHLQAGNSFEGSLQLSGRAVDLPSLDEDISALEETSIELEEAETSGSIVSGGSTSEKADAAECVLEARKRVRPPPKLIIAPQKLELQAKRAKKA